VGPTDPVDRLGLEVKETLDDVAARFSGVLNESFVGSTGAFIDEYVAPGSGGLTKPMLFSFIPQQQVLVTAP
jgi:hypothetical protein